MDDPARPRTPRKSALVYKEIIQTGIIDYDYNPDPYEQNNLKWSVQWYYVTDIYNKNVV